MSPRWLAIALLVVAAVVSGLGATWHVRALSAVAWTFFAIAVIVVLRARRR